MRRRKSVRYTLIELIESLEVDHDRVVDIVVSYGGSDILDIYAREDVAALPNEYLHRVVKNYEVHRYPSNKRKIYLDATI